MRVLPIAIVVGLLVAGGAGAGIYLAVKSETNKVTEADVAKTRAELSLLPMAEQLPKWRALAAPTSAPELQEEAFSELAWQKDPAGIPLIIAGLSSPDKNVRGTAAAAIFEYGTPAADAAKPALLAALKDADQSNKDQILWALAVLHEPSAFDMVLEEYKAGNLSSIQRLDGRRAFDPEEISRMVPLDKIASLAGDPSDGVRQLVASVLTENPDKKWTDVLLKLVADKNVDVAREAAVGLGKIGTDQAMAPLLAQLKTADPDSRQKFIEALRDGVGGRGLVYALKTVTHETLSKEKFQTQQLFQMLKDLADPRAGDALLEYINTANPSAHWKTEAAMRMAEIGDVRCAPTLAWRLTQSPLKLYNDLDFPELKRNDDERVFAARMLADLAVIHPEKRDELRKAAEDATFTWFNDNLLPHANGMRFLSLVGSASGLAKMKAWADPSNPLPRTGDPNKDFEPEWKIAPSALRYIGVSKDPSSWTILEKQMHRKPAAFDASMETLMQGNLGSMLGLTLGALAGGAAQGFSEWGDPKAFQTLVDHIENAKENDSSRGWACSSLPWVASDDQMKQVVVKLHDLAKADVNTQSRFLRACYLDALLRRPVSEATAGLFDLLSSTADPDIRHIIARAIGLGGMSRSLVPQMMDKLKDENTKDDAALALMLGADSDTVLQVFGRFNADADAGSTSGKMEELKEMYNQAFDFWSDRNYDSGDLARWVENAEALTHAKVNGVLQDWPKVYLSHDLVEGIEMDNGPHSVTRVQLRARLLADAKGTNDVKRSNAVSILKFLQEKGSLMALKETSGPVAELARQAFFEVMNPKATSEKPVDLQKAQNVLPQVPAAGPIAH